MANKKKKNWKYIEINRYYDNKNYSDNEIIIY